MEHEISMTQDCVEWNENEGDSAAQQQTSNNTPSSLQKVKNPIQEVEDLWQLLGCSSTTTKAGTTSPLRNNLQRSHSYPMRRRHTLATRHKSSRVSENTYGDGATGDRKRKRPSSANDGIRNRSGSLSRRRTGPNSPIQTTNTTMTVSGFEDLLKQLDSTPTSKEKLNNTTAAIDKTCIMPPPTRIVPSTRKATAATVQATKVTLKPATAPVPTFLPNSDSVQTAVYSAGTVLSSRVTPSNVNFQQQRSNSVFLATNPVALDKTNSITAITTMTTSTKLVSLQDQRQQQSDLTRITTSTASAQQQQQKSNFDMDSKSTVTASVQQKQQAKLVVDSKSAVRASAHQSSFNAAAVQPQHQTRPDLGLGPKSRSLSSLQQQPKVQSQPSFVMCPKSVSMASKSQTYIVPDPKFAAIPSQQTQQPRLRPNLLVDPKSALVSTSIPKIITPSTTTTTNSTLLSQTSEFDDDDFDLSAADLAALDAVVATKAPPPTASLRSSTPAQSESTHKIVAGQTKASPHVDTEDEFGDLDLSFVDLDGMMQQKGSNTTSLVGKPPPPRESFGGDPFDDGFDFAALDQKIAARGVLTPAVKAPPNPRKSILKSSVDLDTIQIPPPDAKIWNSLVNDFDPNHSGVGFSRYQVVAVREYTSCYTKAVMVKSWTSDMNGRDKSQATLHKSGSFCGNRELSETLGEGWIFLRGEWYHTPIGPKDAIHLCSVSGRYQTNLDALPVILHTNPPHGSDSDDDLILVLHPDTLVAPTIVSETVSCSRRAVLRSRLGSTGISNKAALYGTMRHSLFEQCMSHQKFSINFAKESTLSIVRYTAENLVALSITEAEAQQEVLRVLPQLQKFRRDFIGTGPMNSRAAKIEGNGVKPDMKFIARTVEGCEESIVSPEFGLKGNIDVTVKATTQDVASHFVVNPADPESSLVGIELKTGHNQNPQSVHMAQLALYTLLLSVRYGKSSQGDHHASNTGMLLYMNHQGIRAVRVSPLIQELKSLIGQRNVVASDLSKSAAPRGVQIVYEGKQVEDDTSGVTIESAPPAVLPGVLSGAQPCSRCYQNRECMLYAAADLSTKSPGQEGTIQISHSKLLSHFCGHLEHRDLRYFLDWDRLIDLEADTTAKSISSTWLTSSLELERSTRRTVSSLVLEDRFIAPSQEDDITGSIPITFYRSKDALSTAEFTSLSFEPGCLVVISTDATTLSSSSEEQRRTKVKTMRNTMHIARGIVDSVKENKIIVRISQQESRQLNREREKAMIQRRNLTLRLDRDDVQTGLSTTRQNLINLFTGDVKPFDNIKADPKLSQNQFARNRYSWLRDSIVRLKPPQYDPKKCDSMFDETNRVKIPGCDMKTLEQEFDRLNEDQQRAVKNAFSAKDYSLIQGLPGTGKSSTTVFVARLMAAHGKRVLITSYTHAAVDNLMMKLIQDGVSAIVKSNRHPRIIRIGNKSSAHPAVHPILLTDVASNLQQLIQGKDMTLSEPSADALKAILANARIVGVTALSIPRSSALVGQDFDVVIIDEAGQISQPAILGALMAADTFVLVGDHKQLPPLVTSTVAEKAGFGVSMLSRLAEAHPSCVAQLTLQYRMHEDICRICNDIVYGGTLKCANEEVRTTLLKLKHFDASGRILDSWLSRIINPRRPVVFANTDYFEASGTSPNFGKQLVDLERSPEKSGHGNMVNDKELLIVQRIIYALLEAGLSASSIGVISPFRAQVQKLNESDSMAHWKMAGLEISTIDRYQGRDKQVIIISFVRSNNKAYTGRLLNDFRRLNVAVSRAMKKLIMVGSYSTLHSGSTVLRPVLEGLEARKQVDTIPEQILRCQI